MERSGWIKYDDGDPKTWPEDGSWVLWQHKRGGMKVLRWKQDAQNHFYLIRTCGTLKMWLPGFHYQNHIWRRWTDDICNS